MTVSVASRRIDRLNRISDLGQLVLGLIDPRLAWLNWAIADTLAVYRFDDEDALVAGVQAGLHASPLLLMPALGLLVGPLRLMALAPDDVAGLVAAERPGCGKVATAAARKVLANNMLLAEIDLADGAALLADLKVDTAPLFQCMTLADRLAMHALVGTEAAANPPPPLALQQDAAAFALAESWTALEFADYFQAYLTYVAAMEAGGDSTEVRAALVGNAVAMLKPMLFGALECPRVDGPKPQLEVAVALDEWRAIPRRLGFSRLSQGVQQLIAYTGFTDQDEDEAKVLVAAYLAGAQALLASRPLGPGTLGQDGSSWTFNVESDSEAATVALGADGVITLSSYRPLPKRAAASSTS
jgi:hypothetical protein